MLHSGLECVDLIPLRCLAGTRILYETGVSLQKIHYVPTYTREGKEKNGHETAVEAVFVGKLVLDPYARSTQTHVLAV